MSTLRTTNIKNPDSIGNNLILDESGGVVISGVTTVTTLNATQITGVSGGMVVSGITTVSAGSTSAPSISPSGDSNTGVFFPSADTVALSSGGTERIKVDSSGNIDIDSGGVYYDAANNRLAVGTTSPSQRLNLNIGGDQTWLQIDKTRAADEAMLQLVHSATNRGSKIRYANADSSWVVGIDNSESFVFTSGEDSTGAGGTERARIDTSGRLLVGTSSARISDTGVKIQVEALGGDSPGIGIFSDWTNASEAGASFLFLSRAGSSTIGSTTAVANGNELGSIRFRGHDGTGFINAASITASVDGTPGANDMPGRLVFSTTADGASSPTERMRISNLGLISGISETHWGQVSTTQSAGTTYFLLSGYYSGTAGSGGSGTLCVRIWSNGNIINTNNSYGAISDIKLKENIVDAASQWNDLKALQVRNYNFKEGQTHTQIGLIAQEVELVSPGLVSESPDRDEEGNDLGTTTKSVNYSVLYMKAVKALQEAMERIETLESENTTLKDDFIELAARVSALEGN